MSVPTVEMRNGDFRGLVDSQGRRYNIYDPFTTQGNWSRSIVAYNGVANTIDPARISPVAKFLLDHTAVPTHPNINPLVDANWIGTFRRRSGRIRGIFASTIGSDKDLALLPLRIYCSTMSSTEPTARRSFQWMVSAIRLRGGG
jgi:hypothetical protein